ncbi:MAG TPA: alkaline phosphatase PhoX [Spongiibacteraceae bacterium]
MKKLLLAATIAVAVSTHAADFGQKVEQLAKSQSLSLFGTIGTLGASSSVQTSAADANADATKLLTVAPGLTVKVISAAANLAPNIDQIAFWPSDTNPTHIIACNEQGSGQVGVQSIEIATGAVHTIIASGLTSCDPTRRTPWGTIIVGEENGTAGRIFEILDPLNTTNVTVPNSGYGASSDPTHVVALPALGQFAFEGIGILPNGVVYLSDENRPGTGGIGNPGGAIVKFVPTTLWSAGAPAITSLAQSPWTSGSIYGLRVGRNSGNTDVGQGNEFGRGTWVAVTGTAPINLRAAANTLKLTAYYRPEDMSLDPKQLALGKVRACGTATAQDIPATTSNGDNNWGELYCLTDGTVADAATSTSVPEIQPFVFGNYDFAMPDNIDIQPGRGLFLINEDGEGPTYATPRNNDIFACLDDGADADQLSDGCVKLMTLNDLTAESTGGTFDASGKRYFVSIQHNITGHGVILEVDGWQ